jgi:Rod binding domain-containing protein
LTQDDSSKLFGKDAGDKIYNSMYNDALSDSMSGKFGFSELLFNYLKENN